MVLPRMPTLRIIAVLLCLAGCHDDQAILREETTPPLILSAGVETLDPVTDDSASPVVDLNRLAMEKPSVTYDLTTPVDEPFDFSVITRSRGGAGGVTVSVAHALDGGGTPAGGPETLSAAGFLLNGAGSSVLGPWFDVAGEGFARLTIKGSVTRDHVLAVKVWTAAGEDTALVNVRIGPTSTINVATWNLGDYPGVLESATLYSSDSWRFGLPTVAVSGDRTSIVTYEGDGTDAFRPDRYEMRLQVDHATGAVTGGASLETNPDSGNWRDHEIAALYNVLAVVANGSDAVTIQLSFDRGTTFSQTATFPQPGWSRSHLVQTAIALDYTLAAVFWTEDGDESELMLVEGRPSAFDSVGSPRAYEFDSPEVIAEWSPCVMPAIMGMKYSEGGDLVIGYGFTQMFRNEDRSWTNLTQYRCWVRLYDSDDSDDRLVDEERMTGYDPSVSLLGSGPSMKIFYAYEVPTGIRLRLSLDAGETFSSPVSAGDRWAQTPTILARMQGAQTRVDLLWIQSGGIGNELYIRHWDDFSTTPPNDYRLTTAARVESPPPPEPVPGEVVGISPLISSRRLTQVAWFGYDATLDGDDVVVAYDEHTDWFSYWTIGAPMGFFIGINGPLSVASSLEGDGFMPADPPPLAPGLTEPVPPPDPAHRHQLKYLRLD